jgi:hypothetical protein
MYIPDAITTPLNAPMEAKIFSFEAPLLATGSSNKLFTCKGVCKLITKYLLVMVTNQTLTYRAT